MRTRLVLAGLFSSLLATAGPAAATPVAAVAPGNTLIIFDTATPGSVTSRAIAGLGANETVRGVDVRPANEQVFISTVTTGSVANSIIRTYRLDTVTGTATFVGATAAALAGAGDVPTGYDFNPFVDRIRYVNTNDENGRLNPDNGALAGNDTDLTPAATTTLIGAAYDRNLPGGAAATLFVIDRNDSVLARQGGVDGVPSPNGGVVTDVGALGFTLNQANDGGLDISPTGTAYAALTSAADNLTRLYTINLATGQATGAGTIGDGSTQVYSLAILDGDSDRDGVVTSADNCDSVANADQADLDTDGQGDACDGDQDGDGIPDAIEAQLGTNARAADSDGDSRPDGADRCPSIAATTANGCPEIPVTPPALGFTITGFSSKIALKTLRSRGVSLRVQPTQAASFLIELRGRLRGARVAGAGDLILAERRLGRATGQRAVRLKIPRSQLSRLRRGARLTLRVTATDAGGRTVVHTRRLTTR